MDRYRTFLVGIILAIGMAVMVVAPAEAKQSANWNETCDKKVCTRTLYSETPLVQDSGGNWVDASEVLSITADGNDITFGYDGFGDYYDITFEVGVIYNGSYYSLKEMKKLVPRIEFSFPSWKRTGYHKYAINISNIPEKAGQDISAVTLTYKKHRRFPLESLLMAKGKVAAKGMELRFDDLKEEHSLSTNLAEKRIYIGNISENIVNGTLYLDPTVQLQVPDTENLEDAFVSQWLPDDNFGDIILFVGYYLGYNKTSYLMFNNSFFVGKKILNAELGVYIYDDMLEQNDSTVFCVREVSNTTWDEMGITYNQQPGWNDTINCTTYDVVNKPVGYYVFNVTSWVNESNSQQNISFDINLSVSDPDPNDYVMMYSKETGDASTRPYLKITYWVYDAPYWFSNSSSTPAEYNPHTFSYFNVSWNVTNTSTNVSAVVFESNWSGSWVNVTMTNVTYGGAIYNYTAILGAGYHCWKSWASNSIGDWNATDTWCFTISKNSTNPIHSNISGSIDANRSGLSSEGINVSCYLDYANSGTALLWINGSSYANPTYQPWGVGVWDVVCNTSGNANYTANATGMSVSLNITEGGGGGGSGAGVGTSNTVQAVCGNGYCEKGEYENQNASTYCTKDCIVGNRTSVFITPSSPNAYTPGGAANLSWDFVVLNSNPEKTKVKLDVVCVNNDPLCKWFWIENNGALVKSMELEIDGGTPQVPGASGTIHTILIFPENASVQDYRADLVASSVGAPPGRSALTLSAFGGDYVTWIVGTIWNVVTFKLLPFTPATGWEGISIIFPGGIFMYHLIFLVVIIAGVGWVMHSFTGGRRR